MAMNPDPLQDNDALRQRAAGSALPEETVVDLSPHAERLMAYEDLAEVLTPDQEARLVAYVKAMLDMSHARISRRYDHWLEADRAHDVYVPPDATSLREKAVIADTRAIADTVLTYLMAALAGRNPMFQLEGLNRRSRQPSMILERVLHQHMRQTGSEARMAQILLDSIRYGFAPTKVLWDAQANQNRLINFDPRRCFPDPRITWGNWDAAQFIVFVGHASHQALIRSGLYPRLAKDPELRRRHGHTLSGWAAHKWHREEGRGLSIDPALPLMGHEVPGFMLGQSRVIDEAWVCVAGYEIGLPQLEQAWLVVTILDEKHVIRLGLNPYGRQFPVVFGGLYQDAHKTHGQGLYDLLLPMHHIGTYLLRSRIDNISAALNNLIFADPTQVSIPDLIDRNPWGVVRTLPGANPGDGVFIAQVPDVTRGHINDIGVMSELKQRVSAASDAQQGMPTADGIRTATEIQRLTQLGSQRLGVTARILSATTIRPMVTMMVQNLQDALALEGSIRMDERNTPQTLAPMIDDGYLDFDQTSIQGQIEYLVIDGTLPVEPSRSAETWINILQIMSQTGLAMEYDVGQVAEEAIRAMGVTDLERFRVQQQANPMALMQAAGGVPPEMAAQAQGMSPSQQMQMMEMMRGASVRPGDQVAREVEAGNLVPISQRAQSRGAA